MTSIEPQQPELLTTPECTQLNDWSKQVGWDTDYQQWGGGEFAATFAMSVSDDIRIGNVSANREMTVAGIPPEDYLPIILPQSQNDSGLFQGEPLDVGDAAIMCPNSEAFYHTPENSNFFSVSIPVARLRKAVAVLSDKNLDPLITDTRKLALTPAISKQISIATQRVVALAHHSQSALARLEAEEQLIAATAIALSPLTTPKPTTLASRNRTQYFNTARDYIENNLNKALGLETLARETGVSPRTVRYAFQQVLGINPLQYIKRRRLLATRRVFLAAQPNEVTVTGVAVAYGFCHLGYFSRDYQELFGEFPSETINRGGVGATRLR